MKKSIYLLLILLVFGCSDNEPKSTHIHISIKESTYSGLTFRKKGDYFLQISNNTKIPMVVKGISYIPYYGEITQWVVSVGAEEMYSFKDKKYGVWKDNNDNGVHAIYIYTKDGALKGFFHRSYLKWEKISEF